MKRSELGYLLAGAGLGAVVSLLFTPSAGRDLRSTLTNRTQEGLDRISQKVDEGKRYVQDSDLGRRAGETIRNVVERGKTVANMGRDRVNDSVEAGKEKFGESMESSKDWDASSF